jgi:hypothetical protein
MLPSDVWKLETIRIKHKDRKDKGNYVYKLLVRFFRERVSIPALSR